MSVQDLLPSVVCPSHSHENSIVGTDPCVVFWTAFLSVQPFSHGTWTLPTNQPSTH